MSGGAPAPPWPRKVSGRTPPAAPMWVSVLATKPNWKGLTPRRWRSARPALRAQRTKLDSGGGVAVHGRYVGLEVLKGQQLVAAQLVGGLGTEAAFGLALVLHDLDQRLPVVAQGGGLPRQRSAVGLDGLEHQAVAEVGVVRNGQHVAAGQALAALAAQAGEEAIELRLLDVADRQFRHRRVLEQDVAVQVVAAGRAGPFVADEGGEATGIGFVLIRRRGLADRLPRRPRRLAAAGAVGAAEAEAARRQAVGRLAVGDEEGEAREVALDHARQRVVAGEVGTLADGQLAEQLGVIGDGGEVERAGEAQTAGRPAVGEVRLDAERLAAREAVGVGGHGTGALGAGIERQRGVDVEIAEIGAAQRVVADAAAGAVGGTRQRGARPQDHATPGTHRAHPSGSRSGC